MCGVAIVMFLATSEANFPFSMERLFCVFVRYDGVRISFHFQLLWRSIIVINRGCWCRSVCFRTSSRLRSKGFLEREVPPGVSGDSSWLLGSSFLSLFRTCSYSKLSLGTDS